MEKLRHLRCMYCKGLFTKIEKYGDSMILSCSCSDFPLVDGILYLRRDNLQKKAIAFLNSGAHVKALITLLDLKRSLLYAIYFIYLLRKRFKFPDFNECVRLLAYFSYDKKWVWYLVNRARIPSFFLSITATNLIKEDNIVAELGCGTGHLLPELSVKTKPENIYAVDKSFLNLLFARMFFAHPDNLLICADCEMGLPFRGDNLDFISAVDTFHYINNKRFFLTEINRVMSRNGNGAIIHTLSTNTRTIKGVSFEILSRLLEKSYFKKTSIYSNESLWFNLNRKIPINLNKSDTQKDLKNSYSFNFFVTKNKFDRNLVLNNKQFELLKQTPIFYGWEPKLSYGSKIKVLTENYEQFLFISPHLDDAVLSCGDLIELLISKDKKVKVATVFCKATKQPYSPQAKKYLNSCGYTDAEKLFVERRKEDMNALKVLGVGYKHFDFIDAAWRKDDRESFIYPNEIIQFSGRIPAKEKPLIIDLEHNLETFIRKNYTKRLLIFAPLGVGGHADHLITRSAVEYLAKELGKPVLFWEDFPYNTNAISRKKFFLINQNYYPPFCINDLNHDNKKLKAIKKYKSQMKGLFPKRLIPKLPEIYYIRKDLISAKKLLPEASGK